MAITFEIQKTLFSVPSGSMNLELNLVIWNNAKPKYGLRKWDNEHEKMSKGITLTEEEVIQLFSESENILKELGAECIPSVDMSENVEYSDKLPFED